MFKGISIDRPSGRFGNQYVYLERIDSHDGSESKYKFSLQRFHDSHEVEEDVKLKVKRISEEAIKNDSGCSSMLLDDAHLEFELHETQAGNLVRKLSQIPSPESANSESLPRLSSPGAKFEEEQEVGELPSMYPAANASVLPQPRDISLADYQQRLKLLIQSPYREYCDAFLSTVCAAGTVAEAVTSGKFQLSAPKRQKALSYGVSILCDAGGVLAPMGTIQKATNDVADYFFGKSRKKGYQRTADMTSNPMHFVFFAQALTDCLLFCFEPSWAEGLDAQAATSAGKKLAETLMSAIRHKELQFAENASLAARLDGCIQHIIAKRWIVAPLQENGIWVMGRCEDILLMATAQTLQLSLSHFFVDLDDMLVRLEQLERALESESEKVEKSVYATFLEENAVVEGGEIEDVVLIDQSKKFLPNVSKEQRELDADFINTIEPKKVRATFAPSGARLKNVNMKNIVLVKRSMDFTGGARAATEPSMSSASTSSSSADVQRRQSRQAEKKREDTSSSRQQSPSHCSSSSFPSATTQSRIRPPTKEHKQLVNEAERLICQVYGDEDSQSERKTELTWLNQFRGRRLSPEEVGKLKKNIEELKEDLPQAQEAGQQVEGAPISVNPT